MRLYYADIRGIDEKDALYPPISKNKGSALGVSLLAEAYNDYIGAPLPKIMKLLTGKPFLLGDPEYHFSMSHSKTHVFCALSSQPVGVDTEAHRAIRPSIVERLTTPEELDSFSFFDIWVLRESLFKLTNEGSLRTMRFSRHGGEIISPVSGVHCRLYSDIEGSSAAVSCYDGKFPDRIIKIPIEKLLKKDAIENISEGKKTKVHTL